MAEKIRLEIEDATPQGLQSVDQQFTALQNKQKAQQEAFVRANAEAFVNAEHEAHQKVAADFAAMLERQAKERERFQARTAPVQGPLTPEQHAAAETGRKIAEQQRADQSTQPVAPLIPEPDRPTVPVGADTYEFDSTRAAAGVEKINAEAEQAAATFEKLKAEVDGFNRTLERAAEYSDRLSDEIHQVDFPEAEIESVRALWREVDNTRNATELAAQSFEKLGQQDAADRLRMGLAKTADSALRLKTSLNQLEVRKLASEMNAAGNAAQATAVDLGKAARESHLAATGFNRLEQAATASAGRRSGSGQGILQLAYAVDDVQYGLRGIVNNIPMLVQGLGASAAAAGKLAIVAVVISQIAMHYEDLQKVLSNPNGWNIAKDHASKAMSQVADTINANLQAARKAVVDFAGSWGLVPDAVQEFADAELEATGKSIVAREKLAAEKAKNAAASKALTEADEAATKRKWQSELTLMSEGDNAVAALTAKAKALRDAINAPTGKGYLTKTPEQIEKEKEKLIEVEAALDRVTQAKNKAAKAQNDADVEASHKRETDFRNSELKTLDQVRERLAEIERLKKGSSTGVSGDYDLSEKAAKRLHAEQQSLLDQEANLLKAMRDRAEENRQQANEFTERLADQNAELEKQTALNTALHDIEQRRAAVNSGADDPAAEQQRQKTQSDREAFLDRVRAKTEHMRQVAEQAANDESLTDQQKQQRRDAYNQAVMNQITAEANARRKAAEEQVALDNERAQKSAALDREALAVRQQAAAAAEAEYQRAVEADVAADADARDDERRKKATQDLADARSAKAKAEAELQKQIADNEQARKDRAEKNQQTHTKQRIADEIAVGKAREKAMLDAAIREQEIEDAKRQRQQAALQQEPRLQQAAQQIGQRIKRKEVVNEARKRRQDEAAKKFIRERQQQGKKVNKKDIKAVRDKAGRQFQDDLKKGKVEGELAQVANEMFNAVVDQTRGLGGPVAAALKAIAAKAAQDLIDAAEQKQDVEKAGKANLGGNAQEREAARKRNRTPEEVEAEKREELNKRQAELNKKRVEQGLPPLDFEAKPEKKPTKTAAEVREEMAAKKKASEEAAAAAKAEREQQERERQAVVDENVRKAQEKAALDNETPEQKLAREQKEDEEFRKQREAEHDASQRAAFEASQKKEQQEKEAFNKAFNAIPGLPEPPAMPGAAGNDEITIEANADTAKAEQELDALTQDRVVNVRVDVEQPDKLTGREATDTINVKRDAVPPLENRQATDTIQVRREPQFADGPRPQREPVRFADDDRSHQSAAAASIRAVQAALKRMADAEAKRDDQIVNMLNALGVLVSDITNRHVQVHGVVNQLFGEVSKMQTQFIAADDSARIRSVHAAWG